MGGNLLQSWVNPAIAINFLEKKLLYLAKNRAGAERVNMLICMSDVQEVVLGNGFFRSNGRPHQ